MPDARNLTEPAGWLVKSLEDNPEAIRQSRLVTRAAVEALWSEIDAAQNRGFSLTWIWQTLHDKGMIAVRYNAFRKEVLRRSGQRSGRAAGASTQPPQPAAVLAPLPSSGAAAAPNPEDGITPSTSARETIREQPAPPLLASAPTEAQEPDEFYYRPNTPEERAARKAAARARVEAREAVEAAAAKAGEPG